MPLTTSVAGLPAMERTPHFTPPGLPPLAGAPLTPGPVKHESSRARMRAERQRQYEEEERKEDERAFLTTNSQLRAIMTPFDTVKMEFEDLDGLCRPFQHRHDPAPLAPRRPRRSSLRAVRDPAISHHTSRGFAVDNDTPEVAAMLMPTRPSVPPLTPDATIRASLYPSIRSAIPSAFLGYPSSPKHDGFSSLGRKSTRRSRRRVSADRAPRRNCEGTQAPLSQLENAAVATVV